MNIYLPWTKIHPDTVVALGGYGVKRVDVRAHPASYPMYFDGRWQQGEAFINVEHDVVPTGDMLAALKECPMPWCWHAYADQDIDWPYPMLGLVKIGAEMIARTPNMWYRYLHRSAGWNRNPDTQRLEPMERNHPDDLELPPWTTDPPWTHCDEWCAAYARRANVPDHRHYPDVVHRHGVIYAQHPPEHYREQVTATDAAHQPAREYTHG